MAKVTINGDAMTITSTMSLEDIKTVKKYKPNALTLWGGEDGKDPIFVVSVGESAGINKHGVVFNKCTRNDEKLATLTVMIECSENVADYVSDTYGAAIVNLNKLEEIFFVVLVEINSEKAEIQSNITVIQ